MSSCRKLKMWSIISAGSTSIGESADQLIDIVDY